MITAVLRQHRERCLKWVRLAGSYLRCRRRLVYLGTTGLLAAILAMPFSAALTSQRTVSNRIADENGSPFPEDSLPTDDGLLYVHQKLMQTTVSNSGAPVLRFVDCRHYAEAHTKVVQVGVTPDGRPMFRFVAGNYCLFTATAAASAGPKSVELNLPSIREDTPRPVKNAKFETKRINGGLTPYQRYACEKFGTACGIALAIQAAENPSGECEIYHYNSNGTLDWGYFQINTVHLRRPGVNLRDLLDCKKNIDYAYQLFRESGFEPWTTYTTGEYQRFLSPRRTLPTLPVASGLLISSRPLLRSE